MNAQLGPNTPLGPPPAGEVTDFNNPRDQERFLQIVITMPIVVTLSSVCIVARLYSRAFVVKRFGWDDFFAFLALLCNIGCTYCWVGEINTGLTDKDWNVRALEWLANDLPTWYTYNGLVAIFLWWETAFIKISILCLYVRLLGNTRPRLRAACYVMMFVCFAISLICMIDLFTQCTSVNKLFHWNDPGTCNIQPILFFAQALLGVLTDVAILVPPIPFIWTLSTTTSRKLGFSLILSLGLFVTCIALARTIFVSPNILGAQYQLYSEFNNTYWALLEVNCSITVICLPALNQLGYRFWRAMQDTSARFHGGHLNSIDQSPEPGSDVTPSPLANARGRKKERSPISQLVSRFMSDMNRSRVDERHYRNGYDGDTEAQHYEKSIDGTDSVGRGEPHSYANSDSGAAEKQHDIEAAGTHYKDHAAAGVHEMTSSSTNGSGSGSRSTDGTSTEHSSDSAGSSRNV